ncbi:hypothetical protein [Cellulomonas dongxiuzhuiae]|uniref:Uncharacterized protein n=1 Tax=Cellulomonas dongxiuzhuiae TaxID=2819979 RepID=A0ABX8GIS2_9CELL|nr:hypothetical protein [Cellulomonas dongxiuzhuiae]MBO3094497.1 hypothetical protein [Cellulomonas dongxiuzhuiae]QWC15521.1 hypothetical protein KKR89_14660 [Cellulomonas dongxiuzhuiae]
MRRVPTPLPADDVTTALRLLAREWATRLAGAADVDGPDVDGDGSESTTLHPYADGAYSVAVTHRRDRLVVSVAALDGWTLPRTREGVAVVRAVADMAIAGEIEVGTGAWWVRCYRVTLPDGTVLTDTTDTSIWRRLILEDRGPWRTRWHSTSTPYV